MNGQLTRAMNLIKKGLLNDTASIEWKQEAYDFCMEFYSEMKKITINGKINYISREDYNIIQNELTKGGKIAAIKHLRSLFNPILGIVESKNAVENPNNFEQKYETN
jgi:hypothetical protein